MRVGNSEGSGRNFASQVAVVSTTYRRSVDSPVSIKKAQLNKIGRSRRIHEGARQKTSNFLDALISQLRGQLLGPREVRDCFVLVSLSLSLRYDLLQSDNLRQTSTIFRKIYRRSYSLRNLSNFCQIHAPLPSQLLSRFFFFSFDRPDQIEQVGKERVFRYTGVSRIV